MLWPSTFPLHSGPGAASSLLGFCCPPKSCWRGASPSLDEGWGPSDVGSGAACCLLASTLGWSRGTFGRLAHAVVDVATGEARAPVGDGSVTGTSSAVFFLGLADTSLCLAVLGSLLQARRDGGRGGRSFCAGFAPRAAACLEAGPAAPAPCSEKYQSASSARSASAPPGPAPAADDASARWGEGGGLPGCLCGARLRGSSRQEGEAERARGFRRTRGVEQPEPGLLPASDGSREAARARGGRQTLVCTTPRTSARRRSRCTSCRSCSHRVTSLLRSATPTLISDGGFGGVGL